MKSYEVIWKIDIDADTPADAARQALEIQRDPNSLATQFDVIDQTSWIPTEIDLEPTQ